MADIELVIKMPEEKYNQIINGYQGSNVRPKDYEIAIINGTPLPKGHGDLIDRDELELDTDWDDYYDGYCGYSEEQIRYAEVIIEADRSDSK